MLPGTRSSSSSEKKILRVTKKVPDTRSKWQQFPNPRFSFSNRKGKEASMECLTVHCTLWVSSTQLSLSPPNNSVELAAWSPFYTERNKGLKRLSKQPVRGSWDLHLACLTQTSVFVLDHTQSPKRRQQCDSQSTKHNIRHSLLTQRSYYTCLKPK